MKREGDERELERGESGFGFDSISTSTHPPPTTFLYLPQAAGSKIGLELLCGLI